MIRFYFQNDQSLHTRYIVWLSDLALAKWLDVISEGRKPKHKVTALIVLPYFTLSNKQATIQMASFEAWQEQRPYLFGNLCAANTANHPSSSRLTRTQSLTKVKDYNVCE